MSPKTSGNASATSVSRTPLDGRPLHQVIFDILAGIIMVICVFMALPPSPKTALSDHASDFVVQNSSIDTHIAEHGKYFSGSVDIEHVLYRGWQRPFGHERVDENKPFPFFCRGYEDYDDVLARCHPPRIRYDTSRRTKDVICWHALEGF